MRKLELNEISQRVTTGNRIVVQGDLPRWERWPNVVLVKFRQFVEHTYTAIWVSEAILFLLEGQNIIWVSF